MSTATCQSCGMPLLSASDHAGGDDSAHYCTYCVTESGQLQPFEERFERMTQWAMRKDGIERADAEARTRDYMRTMPAWRDHPALRAEN